MLGIYQLLNPTQRIASLIALFENTAPFRLIPPPPAAISSGFHPDERQDFVRSDKERISFLRKAKSSRSSDEIGDQAVGEIPLRRSGVAFFPPSQASVSELCQVKRNLFPQGFDAVKAQFRANEAGKRYF